MKRTLKPLVLLGALLAVAILAHPTTSRAQSGYVTTELWIPFPDGFVNDEFVDFTGAIHIVIHAVPPNPVVPPNPIVPPNPTRIHTNVVDVTGIGEATGATYRVTGASQFEGSAPPPGTYEFDAFYRMNSGSLGVRYTVEIDASGRVVGEPLVLVGSET